MSSHTISDDSHAIANEIRSALKLTDKLRKECSSVDDLLRKISANAEALGVLVLRSSVVGSNNKRKLSPEEFRGFAISDDLAPLIFVNGADYVSAQIFTFAHELVHIWIGASGVSNPVLGKGELEEANDVERFCNAVAAEILVPAAEFAHRWAERLSDEENLSALARAFKVSSLVVLRRALDLKKVRREIFFQLYAKQRKEFEDAQKRTKASEGGGDFYATLGIHNSKLFTRTVVASALEGRTLYRDAARLLHVQVPTIFGVAEHLGRNE